MDTAPRYNFKDINVHDLEAATLFEVRGYVAVVTGAGNGVGLMAAQTLAANGARVYIIGTREEILDTIGEKYSFKGRSHRASCPTPSHPPPPLLTRVY